MALVGATLLAALAWVAMNSGSDKGYLFTDLDPTSARDIAQQLDSSGVSYDFSPDGTAVMVPRDRIAELRMSMADQSLGGPIGYELLDNEQPFGMSSEREKLNANRALEGELARSISTLQPVQSARVHIVMPERALFSAEGHSATASVTVKTRGRLSEGNIAAIRSLVGSAVPELSPEQVSIVDQTGRLLARAGESEGMGGDADTRQRDIETRLRSEIETLLEPIVGAGKVRAEVSAEINRDAIRSQARVFDPDAQVISRQISVESGNQNESTEQNGAVSVGQQLPDAEEQTAPGDIDRSSANETSDDTQYDNSYTDTTTVTGPGAIKRLSVAVMVDSSAGALPAAQVQRIQRLVENAVGFNAERGDSVAVEAVEFKAPEEQDDMVGSFLDAVPVTTIMDILKLLVIAVTGLFVLKMIARKGTAGEDAEQIEGVEGAVLTGPDGTPALLQPHNQDENLTPLPAGTNMAALDQEIAMNQVDGGIKASSLKRISEAIEAAPAESASVVRKWMNA